MNMRVPQQKVQHRALKTEGTLSNSPAGGVQEKKEAKAAPSGVHTTSIDQAFTRPKPKKNKADSTSAPTTKMGPRALMRGLVRLAGSFPSPGMGAADLQAPMTGMSGGPATTSLVPPTPLTHTATPVLSAPLPQALGLFSTGNPVHTAAQPAASQTPCTDHVVASLKVDPPSPAFGAPLPFQDEAIPSTGHESASKPSPATARETSPLRSNPGATTSHTTAQVQAGATPPSKPKAARGSTGEFGPRQKSSASPVPGIKEKRIVQTQPGRLDSYKPRKSDKYQHSLGLIAHYASQDILPPERRSRRLSAVEREQYKVKFENGKMLYALSGKPVDTYTWASPVGGKRSFLYVMDPDGSTYVGPPKRGELSHRSYAANKKGLPVAAAGQIEVRNGVVEYVDPLSGHYLPAEGHTDQFATELSANGVQGFHVEKDIAIAQARIKQQYKVSNNAGPVAVLAGVAAVAVPRIVREAMRPER